MRRLVRDLSKSSGKNIHLEVVGEDTEIDKGLVDEISDPLIHLIRNAVDHGIEEPDERRAAEKQDARLILSAAQKGSTINVSIEDDGRGLNREKILEKAIERGVINNGDDLSDAEANQLIMAPGFSTAQKVTNISGRGVGMDVVKKTVERLRGQIEIHSELGEGTKFTLRLPLTMAIIDALVATVGDEHYIIPTQSVVQTLQPVLADIVTVKGIQHALYYQDEVIPIVFLDQYFLIDTRQEAVDQLLAIVLEVDGRRVGVVVDSIIGKQQIVIKPLSRILKSSRGVSGSAILSSGQVGLIMDVEAVVSDAQDTQVFDVEEEVVA